MDASQPRFGGPTRRRSFTPAQKLDHVAAYEAALAQGGGGGYLRQAGLYSSQISEWRRLRDGGVLAGKSAGAKVGRPSAELAEIARLRRQLGCHDAIEAIFWTLKGCRSKRHWVLDAGMAHTGNVATRSLADLAGLAGATSTAMSLPGFTPTTYLQMARS